ncbi:hypothetical protein ACFQH6_17810 [Halobacteriaceae archaeon GCM10025711]
MIAVSGLTTAVFVLKSLTLVVGGLITFFAFKAFRRTGAPALRALAMGFGLVTLGAFLAGAADQVLHLDTNVALIIDSALTATGFAVILYSLYSE